jgi:hypothetical protein
MRVSRYEQRPSETHWEVYFVPFAVGETPDLPDLGISDTESIIQADRKPLPIEIYFEVARLVHVA